MRLSGEIMALIVAATAFLSTFLLICGLYFYHRRRAVERNLNERMQKAISRAPLSDNSAVAGRLMGLLQPLLKLFDFVGKRTVAKRPEQYTALRLRFVRAGLWGANAPAVFWGAKICLGLMLALGFFVLRVSIFENLGVYLEPNQTVLLSTLLALLGFYLPDLWLSHKIGKRKDKIRKSLPDALDLMVICVEAGMGIDAAINRVSQDISLSAPELHEELRLATLEIRAGMKREQALRNLGKRVELEDVRNLVALLIQTDRFGTSMASALRVYADAFRTKRFQIAEEKAAKLPVKLIFPCVLFIFPSIGVVTAGPAFVQLLRSLLQIASNT
ncbi:MAG: type II secretion system F family protein [Desulfobacterales bacterium]|nr:MAG: type II secretion system F family protein [Desulfobacterales bacterium]